MTTTIHPDSNCEGVTKNCTSVGDQTPGDDKTRFATKDCDVVSGPDFPDSKPGVATDSNNAVGDQAPGDDKLRFATNAAGVVSGSDFPKQVFDTKPSHTVGDQTPGDDKLTRATKAAAVVSGPFLVPPLLVTLARTMDEAENAWEAAAAHLRELRDPDLWDLPDDDPAFSTYTPLVTLAKRNHDEVERSLERAMAQNPLWDWAKPIAGVGLKQFARLLAATGDPYWHGRDNRPRRISEFIAYCGLDPDQNGVARKRQRGEKSNWNADAKMRAYLIAKSCIRQIEQPAREETITRGKFAGQVRQRKATPAGAYRLIYEEARAKYETAVHKWPCMQCGTRAAAQTPLTHPLRLKSKYAALADEKFTVDPEGTKKVFQDCTENEKQFIADSGNERYFAQERIADRVTATMIPAPIGSPLKPGHQDAAAIHKVAAVFLKDLWREAKRLHEGD